MRKLKTQMIRLLFHYDLEHQEKEKRIYYTNFDTWTIATWFGLVTFYDCLGKGKVNDCPCIDQKIRKNDDDKDEDGDSQKHQKMMLNVCNRKCKKKYSKKI